MSEEASAEGNSNKEKVLNTLNSTLSCIEESLANCVNQVISAVHDLSLPNLGVTDRLNQCV